MLQNIWIQFGRLLWGYIGTSLAALSSVFFGTPNTQSGERYAMAHELLSKGPRSFFHKPTAVKLGRALFVPIILISHLYDLKTEAKK